MFPHKSTYVNTQQRLLSYRRAFEEYFETRFVNARMLHTVGDVVPSNFTNSNVESFGVGYSTVGQIIIKHELIFPFAIEYSCKRTTRKVPDHYSLNDENFHIFLDILLIIHARRGVCKGQW